MAGRFRALLRAACFCWWGRRAAATDGAEVGGASGFQNSNGDILTYGSASELNVPARAKERLSVDVAIPAARVGTVRAWDRDLPRP